MDTQHTSANSGMQGTDAPAAAAAPATSRPVSSSIDPTGALPGVVGLAACGLYVLTLPPVSDHGWQFYMAERVLDGARLYVDVGAADMHPPLFTWLAMGIALVGRAFGTDGLSIYPVLVFAAIRPPVDGSRAVLRLARSSSVPSGIAIPESGRNSSSSCSIGYGHRSNGTIRI